jgi:hypothetical protein
MATDGHPDYPAKLGDAIGVGLSGTIFSIFIKVSQLGGDFHISRKMA